ncbi:uncharacterized protein CEXT_253751 [Caerostris extrusa]|uniref:Uncharacterized protein n=1 Tax=Caerostris extrusa TaxID=172846 RepID=A0AAV4MHZ4_CAEEX|nr:uncharacterized protein CEXT_253751 [Caerostris extrusa]
MFFFFLKGLFTRVGCHRALHGYGKGSNYGSSVNYGSNTDYNKNVNYESTYKSTNTFTGTSGVYNQNEAPRPYKFDYNVDDEQGTSHYRTEEGDGSGAVRGHLRLHRLPGHLQSGRVRGRCRGFRASIRTNEPGTDDTQSPAGVQLTVDPPPPGLQGQRFPPRSNYGEVEREVQGRCRAGGGGSNFFQGENPSIYPSIGDLFRPGDGSESTRGSGGGVNIYKGEPKKGY